MIGWVLAAIAIVGGIAVVIPWVPRNLNHAAFAEQLTKLFKAGNADRARKLCGAAPRSPVASSLAICIDALGRMRGESGAEVIARLRELYAGAMNAHLRSANRGLYLGAAVIADVAVLVYLITAGQATAFAIAPACLGLLLVLAAFRIARKVAVEGAAIGERMFGVMAESR